MVAAINCYGFTVLPSTQCPCYVTTVSKWSIHPNQKLTSRLINDLLIRVSDNDFAYILIDKHYLLAQYKPIK